MITKTTKATKLSVSNFPFQSMIDYFSDTMIKLGKEKVSTINTYCQHYLPNLDKANGGQTCQWLIDIINDSKCTTPIKDAIDKFDNASKTLNFATKTIADWKVAYRHFANVILGIYYADVWFAYTVDPIELCKMVAMNTLFADRTVVDGVVKGIYGTKKNLGIGNIYASWDNCATQRCTSIKKGQVMPNGKIADDNTYANKYIKMAILLSMNLPKIYSNFKKYQVCHIWESSKYPAYHTSVMNLVLITERLAGLTDNVPEVQQLLRYEIQKRFGCNPSGVQITKPAFYNQILWRN